MNAASIQLSDADLRHVSGGHNTRGPGQEATWLSAASARSSDSAEKHRQLAGLARELRKLPASIGETRTALDLTLRQQFDR